MPRKPPAIEPPEASDLPTPDGPEEEPTPLEGSEPTANAEPQPAASAEPTTEIPEPAASTTSAPGETPRTPPIAGNRFFSWIRGIDVRREPGWIGGVCAGIATRLGVDPLIVRGIAVVIAVLGGPAILLYAVAWLLLPDSNDKIHLEEVFRGRLESPIAAIGALIVLSLLPVTQGFWYAGAGFWGEPHWGSSAGRAIWTVILLGALVWFIVWLARRGSTPATPAATRPRDASAFVAGQQETAAPTTAYPSADFSPTAPLNATEPELAAWREQQAQVRAEQTAFRNQQASDKAAANRAAAEEAQRKRAAQREADRAEHARTRSHPLFSLIVIGLSIVAGGLTTVSLGGGDITPLSAVVGLSVMLAVLAVGIIINGIRGKRSGGAAGLAAIVLPVLLVGGIAMASADTFVRWGPKTVFSPTSSDVYALPGGRVELDLNDFATDGAPQAPDKWAHVELQVGAGDVTVVVPEGVAVQLSGSVAAGSIETGDGELQSNRVGPIQTVFAVYNMDDMAPDMQKMYVTVQLGAGTVTVVNEGAQK